MKNVKNKLTNASEVNLSSLEQRIDKLIDFLGELQKLLETAVKEAEEWGDDSYDNYSDGKITFEFPVRDYGTIRQHLDSGKYVDIINDFTDWLNRQNENETYTLDEIFVGWRCVLRNHDWENPDFL